VCACDDYLRLPAKKSADLTHVLSQVQPNGCAFPRVRSSPDLVCFPSISSFFLPLALLSLAFSRVAIALVPKNSRAWTAAMAALAARLLLYRRLVWPSRITVTNGTRRSARSVVPQLPVAGAGPLTEISMENAAASPSTRESSAAGRK